MAGDSAAPKLDTSKIYYATREELAAAQARAAMRQARKAEYQKQMTNPAKGLVEAGPVFDPAMQRFMSMKVSHWDSHRMTFKNSWAFLIGSVIPVVAIYKYLCFEQMVYSVLFFANVYRYTRTEVIQLADLFYL